MRPLILAALLLCLVGCRFNVAGYLQEEPAVADVVGSYALDPSSRDHLGRMGYKSFAGRVTLNPDGSFVADQIPACCVHGRDETFYPFSGGYYGISGSWKVAKSSAVFVIHLTLVSTHVTDKPPPSGSPEPKDRDAPGQFDIHLMRGSPLSLGFPVFNGDFDDIAFSMINKENAGTVKPSMVH
jgi:hypothetical protein